MLQSNLLGRSPWLRSANHRLSLMKLLSCLLRWLNIGDVVLGRDKRYRIDKGNFKM